MKTDPVAVLVIADNQGQTPAYNVRAHLNWQYMPFGSPLPLNFNFPDYGTETDQNASSTMLQSKGTFPITMPMDLKQLERAQKKETSVFLYGWVKYEDTFGATHSTTFAYEYRPEQKGETITHVFHVLPRYNGGN